MFKKFVDFVTPEPTSVVAGAKALGLGAVVFVVLLYLM